MQHIIKNAGRTEPFVVLGAEIVYKQRAEWFEAHWRQLKLSLLRSRRHFAYDLDTKPLPLIVFIPGGGFSHTERNALLPELVWFAKHGYAVASVEYSATAKTRFPMQIEDIKEAIRYLRAHAEEFGIDPERVAIMGESSGGYLAAFTAMTNGCAEYETGDHRDQSSNVRAAVVMYPVVTPETMYDEIKKPIPMPDARSYPDLCGMAKTGMPPFLILCGDGDVCCPTSQSERLHDALEREGNDVELLIFENTAHADLPLFQAESKARIDEFLREKMK